MQDRSGHIGQRHAPALALAAAAKAVGLPVAGPTREVRCDATGQARAVVALWLAGRATAGTESTLRVLSREAVIDVDGRPYLLVPDFGVPVGAAFGPVEVAMAITLLDRPLTDAATWWDELTDPTTPATSQAARLGANDAGPRLTAAARYTGYSDGDAGPIPRVEGRCP